MSGFLKEGVLEEDAAEAEGRELELDVERVSESEGALRFLSSFLESEGVDLESLDTSSLVNQ